MTQTVPKTCLPVRITGRVKSLRQSELLQRAQGDSPPEDQRVSIEQIFQLEWSNQLCCAFSLGRQQRSKENRIPNLFKFVLTHREWIEAVVTIGGRIDYDTKVGRDARRR